MLLDRLQNFDGTYRLIGLERDPEKVNEGNEKYGNNATVFIECDVEKDFGDILTGQMQKMDIDKFDIINISMLLLHLKSGKTLLRKLRRYLKPGGTVIIKDVDDGLNYVYPDDKKSFERIYRICDRNETSGERHNGRQIYPDLVDVGYRNIILKKAGFNTTGLNTDDKEAFWEMAFKFILGDAKWMHEQYPDNEEIEDDYEWFEENYEDLFDEFMKPDVAANLGLMIYLAKYSS